MEKKALLSPGDNLIRADIGSRPVWARITFEVC